MLVNFNNILEIFSRLKFSSFFFSFNIWFYVDTIILAYQ